MIGLKGNQPSLMAAAVELFDGVADRYETHERGHGRIEHRWYAVLSILEELKRSLHFPHTASFVRVCTERRDLSDRPIGKPETSYYISDLAGSLAKPAAFAYYVHAHWGIENRSHHVRDTTFDEDRRQVRTGGVPQALATLRNVAISIYRLLVFEYTRWGTRWFAWDYTRAMQLLGL